MFIIYNLLSLIALTLYLPILITKKGPENRKVFLKERLGLSDYSGCDLWIHAVSVGEVIASLKFMHTLKKEYPELKILFSTTTYTGQKIARESFPEADRIMYIPCDTALCIHRAVRDIRPRLFIAIETELWPSLFNALNRAGTRIIVLNGRLSENSYRGYRYIRFFMKRVLSNVTFFYMQGNDDIKRIISLGAQAEKVELMGNIKYDISIDETGDNTSWIDALEGRILIAGSTHKGEDEIVLDAYDSIKKSANDLKLILAPRHPERFSEVEHLIKNRGYHFIRRSRIPSENPWSAIQGRRPDIVLLDTVGELSQTFAKADVAFIGGSLMPYGGHNILEPAYWSKPIIFGPFMDNFPMAADFLRAGAAIEVNNDKEMAVIVADILKNNAKAEKIGQKAKTIINANKGALEKAMKLVRGILGTNK
jgi:3-deoxy-D-manno-octulosonic-acid transferase